MRRKIERIVRKHAARAKLRLDNGKEWSQGFVDAMLDPLHDELVRECRPFNHNYHQHFPWVFLGFRSLAVPLEAYTSLCFCDEIEYHSPLFFHVTMTHCSRAKITLCINLKTFEVAKHPLGACPDGNYRSANAS